MNKNLIIVRGGGDVATGTIQKLNRVGFDVLVLEIDKPTCIRRNVAVGQAIYDGEIQIEDINAVRCDNTDAVSYTHLTLPTIAAECRSRWSPYH